jgi:O-methyltransferase involved in polyketide biosynthesis
VECFLGTESLDIFDSGRRFLYWLRFKSVQAPQEQFLRKQGSASDSVPRQIVNLGCGLDTTCFNLLANPERYVDFKYIEIDFPQVVDAKTQIIQEDPKIRKLLGDGVEFGDQLQVRSDRYALASSDITKLDHLDQKLRLAGIDFDVPTMVVTEFVLAYIETNEVEALVDYFTERFPTLCFVDFCTSNIDSEFGKRELTVFQQRGIPFKAKEYYSSPSAVRKTYEDRGFIHESMTMQDMLDNCIDQCEKKRIYSIEPIQNSDPYFFEKMKYSYVQISKKSPAHKQNSKQQGLFQVMQSLNIATAVGSKNNL